MVVCKIFENHLTYKHIFYKEKKLLFSEIKDVRIFIGRGVLAAIELNDGKNIHIHNISAFKAEDSHLFKYFEHEILNNKDEVCFRDHIVSLESIYIRVKSRWTKGEEHSFIFDNYKISQKKHSLGLTSLTIFSDIIKIELLATAAYGSDYSIKQKILLKILDKNQTS